VKDDTVHPDSEAGASAPAASAPRDPTIVHLPLFRPGTRVQYNGQSYTVGHVVVSREHLKVFLSELGHAVEAEKLRLAPTRLVLKRQPAPAGSPV